jgi:hypothetical protein
VELACRDPSVKRRLREKERLDELMDALWDIALPIAADMSLDVLKVLVKVVEEKHAVAGYIPGETMQIEQQRTRSLQQGLVFVLLHTLRNTPNQVCRQLAADHLWSKYTTQELEQCLMLLSSLTHNKNPNNDNKANEGNSQQYAKLDSV